MLLFKRHLVDLVREGKKRQTVRLWRYARVRAGQVCFSPGLGRVKVVAVERVESLRRLTNVDAWADGFLDRGALLREIRGIYGAGVKGRMIFRVRFEWPVVEEARGGGVRGALGAPDVRGRARVMTIGERGVLRVFLVARGKRVGMTNDK